MAPRRAVESDQRNEWLEQWRSASAELAEQHAKELREMTTAEAWEAIESVLSFPVTTDLPAHRMTHSGLVELQEYLARIRLQ